MTLQISKRDGELLDAERGVCSSGWWTVSGKGVHAMFSFDDPRDRGTTYGISEQQAHRHALVFMVAMRNAADPAAMMRAQIEADFNKGCEE